MFDRDEREIIRMLSAEGGGSEAVMGLIEDALLTGEPDSYTESVLTCIYSKLKKIKEES